MGNLTAHVHPGIIRISPPAYTGSYTVTPDEQGEVLETNGKVMTDDVTVNPVPWVKPEGSKNITTNGTHDVEAYKNAVVAVPGPSGTKTITTNGTHDVEAYASADVQVPQGVFPSGTKSITANGTYDVTNFASAEVNTDPAKGFVYDQFDANGNPNRLRVVGFDTVPDYYFETIGAGKAYSAIYAPTILDITAYGIGQNSFYGTSLTNIESIIIHNQEIVTGQESFRNQVKCAEVIFDGNCTRVGGSSFQGCTLIELYDFSKNTSVARMINSYAIGHASGCVIRVPAALLSDWQSATNWNALTDVVWEGV